jgi:hypothetical protein
MSDPNQRPDPEALLNKPVDQQDLFGLVRLLFAGGVDKGAAFLTALPSAYDVGTQGPDARAKKNESQ